MQQYVCMRTTVEIPEPLLKRAKLAAIEQNTTLRQLISRGLESLLRSGTEPRKRLTKPPIKLAANSPLRTLGAEDVARLDAEAEAREADEVYR